jgi:hypothetical protein
MPELLMARLPRGAEVFFTLPLLQTEAGLIKVLSNRCQRAVLLMINWLEQKVTKFHFSYNRTTISLVASCREV